MAVVSSRAIAPPKESLESPSSAAIFDVSDCLTDVGVGVPDDVAVGEDDAGAVGVDADIDRVVPGDVGVDVGVGVGVGVGVNVVLGVTVPGDFRRSSAVAVGEFRPFPVPPSSLHPARPTVRITAPRRRNRRLQ